MIKYFGLMAALLLTLTGCGADWFPDGSKPNAYSFAPQNNVAFNATITSAAVTISGNSVPADVSISNGEYSIGSTGSAGTFTSSPGKINAGQTITVRHTSANTANTATTTVITIGGVSAAFVSTTAAANPAPQAFSFTPKTGVPLSTVITSDTITITGNSVPAAVTVSHGDYSIDGGTFTSAAGTINSGQTIAVHHTSASTFGTATTTTVTIGGVSADFISTTVTVNPNPPPAVTGDPTNTVVLDGTPTFAEAFRDATTVTETITIGLINNDATTGYTVRVGFDALDAGKNIIYTGFIEGPFNPSDAFPLITNATFDLATFARIASWEVVSITITP